MSGADALAQTLHEAQYGTPARPTDCECEHLAERILADPGPLLAALAEAGVTAWQEVQP